VSNTVTVNVKLPATVSLLGLNQTYDGSAKPVTATTSPANLPVTFTYNGIPTAPSAPGTYAVLGTVVSSTYSGSATGTLVIVDSIIGWREAYFGDPANSGAGADAADFDGDMVSNLSEYIFGTDPTTADSGQLLTLGSSSGGLELSFTARAASGAGYAGLTRTYTLQTTTTLTVSNSWTPVAGFTAVVGAGQVVTCTQSFGGGAVFFRLRANVQ
jgi:MBG domain